MKRDLLFKIIPCYVVFLLFNSHSIAQTESMGDRVERLWSGHELLWQAEMMQTLSISTEQLNALLMYEQDEFNKDRGRFFFEVMRGTIDETNATKFFDKLTIKY